MSVNLVRTGPRNGAPVVLLHSAGLDLTYWDHQIESLRREFDVVAIDLPGHGRSAAVAADMHVPAIAASVAEVIASLDTGPVNLVGLSVGGVVAQTLASEYSSLVASLALLDTGARFAPAAQTAMRHRATTLREHGMSSIIDGLLGHWFLPETIRQRPDLADRATKTVLTNDVEVHASLWEMIADFDGLARLSRVHAPTTVMVGEHDSSSPVATATVLADNIAGAQLHVIPNAAHLSPIEQPNEVSHLLQAFLATSAHLPHIPR